MQLREQAGKSLSHSNNNGAGWNPGCIKVQHNLSARGNFPKISKLYFLKAESNEVGVPGLSRAFGYLQKTGDLLGRAMHGQFIATSGGHFFIFSFGLCAPFSLPRQAES
jgi:hypothetical protein